MTAQVAAPGRWAPSEGWLLSSRREAGRYVFCGILRVADQVLGTGPLGPVAVDALPLAGHSRPGCGVDPRWSRDPDRGDGRQRVAGREDAAPHSGRRRPARVGVPARRGRRRAGLRPASPTGWAGASCSWSPWSSTWSPAVWPGSRPTCVLLVLRFIAGTGIGGEYTAINSAIDELIPSHYRGRVDIAVNGTYWARRHDRRRRVDLPADPTAARITSAGASASSSARCWACSRSSTCAAHLPESPRWLMTHGRSEEAEQIVDDIEARGGAARAQVPVSRSKAIEVAPANDVLPGHGTGVHPGSTRAARSWASR